MERVIILILSISTFIAGFFIGKTGKADEVEIQNLKEQNDMLWKEVYDIKQTAIDLSDICDRFQSSRNAKDEYFKNK